MSIWDTSAGLTFSLAAIDPRKYDCVIVGNNDLTFDEDFLEKLAAGVYTDDTLVVAPNVITKDGYHQNPHCITRVPATRKFLYRLTTSATGLPLPYLGANFLKSLKGGRKILPRTSPVLSTWVLAQSAPEPGFFKHYDRQ
jgi:hypothetical protein